MSISEDTLSTWSKGPSQTESERCTNAELAVRKAIKAFPELHDLDISVFAQGSYRARTNVRQKSDVDICVRYNGSFFPNYPTSISGDDLGHVDSSFTFSDFKGLVQLALEDYFGEDGVTRGNKAFQIHENTYRIGTDVVPTFEHRRYTGEENADGSDQFIRGVAFKPDKGNVIYNWPQQTYDNGVNRNTSTGRTYKRVIRILKRLRGRMLDEGLSEAEPVPSFLIECLVWNAEVEAFSHDTYRAVVRHVIADLWNRTRVDTDCKEWGEVNELKYLFRAAQPWTRQHANSFLQAAWDYIGYK